MKIVDLFQKKQTLISFEVFPPRRDGDIDSLYRTFEDLKKIEPDYISVTYGAGGSTQDKTFEIAARLLKTGIVPLVHFTCVGHSQAVIGRQLDQLAKIGVKNILALRGDPPKGIEKFEKPVDGFGYANELIEFIKEKWDFCIGAAAYPETHPEAIDAEHDMKMLKNKIDSGVDFINTQMFFSNEKYFSFIEKAKAIGITTPIVPGIMPVLTPKFFNRDWGASIPAGFQEKYTGDPQSDREKGISFAIEQCNELISKGTPGLHIYTMNKADAALQIREALKV